MKRIFAAAMSAALVLLAACTGQKAPPDVDKVFESHLPWDPDAKGVQTDEENGLQWVVIRKGKGKTSPTSSSWVRVNYEGRTADGKKFDSSYDRGSPVMFPLNRVIRGWTIGLQKMQEGDQFLFHVPNGLAYGDRDVGGVIKAGDDLVFLVDLLQVFGPEMTDAAAWKKYTPWNSDLPDVQKTKSGLEYVVLASGDEAGKSPEFGQEVLVYYEGRLADTGEMFDSAFQRGEPLPLTTDGVIPGWTEALLKMKPGDRWLLHIPARLAYGEQGTPGGPIPPNADLDFEIELLGVQP